MNERIAELAATGMGYRGVTAVLKTEGYPASERGVRKALRELREQVEVVAEPTTRITQQQVGDTLTVEAKGRIRTLEDLLEVVKPDLELWEIATWKSNTWEQNSVQAGLVQLWQVYATFKRRKEVFDLRAMQEAALAEMREYSPNYAKPRYQVLAGETHMLELAVYDLHAGLLAWGEETGGGDYDLKLARSRFEYAVDDLLHKASGMRLEKILFPVGNDLIHTADGYQTTAQTRQDTDSRIRKVFREVLSMTVQAVEKMAQVAPVEIVMVEGNHSRLLEGILGETLKAFFRLHPAVVVNTSPAPRIYTAYGRVLLMHTHGDGIKPDQLPLTMAEEASELWGPSEFREIHMGHLHQRRTTRFQPLAEYHGVAVRVLSSAANSDEWHSRRGYTGNLKAAQAFVWHPKDGLVAEFHSNVARALSAA